MIRRRMLPIVFGLAPGIVLLGGPTATKASAAGVATFRLMNIDEPGAAPTTAILARIIPAGAIIPRNPDTDPPTIIPENTGLISTGFDPDTLQLTLGDGTTISGEPFQALRLDFGPGGLAPGGKLYFQLNRSDAYDGLVRLVLPSDVGNIAIERLDDLPIDFAKLTGTPAPDPGGTTGTPQVPEPAAVLLWAGGGLLGLIQRRRRAT